jgi:hypothetical protein
MYSSHISQELAHARINDQLARAEARRLTAAARQARLPRRRRTGIPAAVRALVRQSIARPAT